VPLRPMTY
nr:Chain C, PEPTIDE VPLRPMTY [Human immunodeficiency virus 1]